MTPLLWVSAFLDLPADDIEVGSRFWADVTGFEMSPWRGDHDEFATLVPADGDDYLRVQRTGGTEPGIHLDLHVDDVEQATAEAVALGASLVDRSPHGCTVLSSPGGLTFCFVTHRASRRPAPRDWGGHRSLVDQVCLDVPGTHHEREVTFWERLTGWQKRASSVSLEFCSLARPDGVPLRFLLQRLGRSDGHVTAHLDLACDDIPAEVDRHEHLGARVAGRFDHWTVLHCPAGSAYCITGRDPQTGLVP